MILNNLIFKILIVLTENSAHLLFVFVARSVAVVVVVVVFWTL